MKVKNMSKIKSDSSKVMSFAAALFLFGAVCDCAVAATEAVDP